MALLYIYLHEWLNCMANISRYSKYTNVPWIRHGFLCAVFIPLKNHSNRSSDHPDKKRKTKHTLQKAHPTGQITIIPKPELRGFWGHFPYFSPPFGVTTRR